MKKKSKNESVFMVQYQPLPLHPATKQVKFEHRCRCAERSLACYKERKLKSILMVTISIQLQSGTQLCGPRRRRDEWQVELSIIFFTFLTS